jgi:hypothetical protein
MNKNTTMIVAIVLVVLAGIGGFVGGMQYQKSQNPLTGGQFMGRNSGNGQGFAQRENGGQGQRFVPVRGQVLSIGNNTITVKLQDGTTKLVVISSSTAYLKTQTVVSSDLKSGDTVMVVGNSNADGSVTASDIQINPQQLRPSGTPVQGQ